MPKLRNSERGICISSEYGIWNSELRPIIQRIKKCPWFTIYCTKCNHEINILRHKLNERIQSRIHVAIFYPSHADGVTNHVLSFLANHNLCEPSRVTTFFLKSLLVWYVVLLLNVKRRYHHVTSRAQLFTNSVGQ